jgi:hypothetical protein
MSAGRCLLAFLGYEVAFLQAVHAIYPYDVTPVTNIIAMVDLMRAAVALFFRFVRVVVSYCTKLVMEARRRA